MAIYAQISKFQEMYDNSQNIVFFGGAGVSTESGIPDFRSQEPHLTQASVIKYAMILPPVCIGLHHHSIMFFKKCNGKTQNFFRV